jgi:dipeptidyl aminopeptidase/acylaminoacyl peptidase
LVKGKGETPPTVLVHGTEDLMVPFEISKKLHDKLRAEGVDTVLLEEDGANHGFDLIPGFVGDKAKMKVFEEALDFVEKYL